MQLGRSLIALALFLLGAVAPARADTLGRIREQGKLNVGYRADARPFSYQDESGKAAGYSIALCQEIAAAIRAEPGLSALAIEYVKVGTEDRLDAVAEGRIDLLCGAATVTLERRKRLSFSIPIFPSGIAALLRADSPERLNAVLEGRPEPYEPRWRASLSQVLEKRILSAAAGTTAESWLAERREALNVNAQIVPVQNYEEGVDRVLARRSHVLFGDRAILLDAAARRSSANELVLLSRRFSYEPVAIGFARGDEELRLLVDRSLSRLYHSGKVREIYSKFFGEPDASTLDFFGFMALPE